MTGRRRGQGTGDQGRDGRCGKGKPSAAQGQPFYRGGDGHDGGVETRGEKNNYGQYRSQNCWEKEKHST